MRIKRESLVVAGLVLFLSMEVTGCMDAKDVFKKKGDKAIEFVEDKYGVEFTPYSYEQADYLSNTDTVWCYAEGMDKENESVKVYITKENGEVEYDDTYFGYLVRPEMEDYVQDMVNTEFDEAKVYVNNNNKIFPNELRTDSSMEDLFEICEDFIVDVRVYVKGSDNVSYDEYNQKIKNIEERLLDSRKQYSIFLFVVNEDIYESMERYEQSEFWQFYCVNREPDGEKYYYVYDQMIMDGKVTK